MFVDTPKEAEERRKQEDKLRMQEAIKQRKYANEIESVDDASIISKYIGAEGLRYFDKGQRVRVIPYERMVKLWRENGANATMELPAVLETKDAYDFNSICMRTNVGTIIGFGYLKPIGDAPRYAPGTEMVQVECKDKSKHWVSPVYLEHVVEGGARVTRRKSRA